MALSGCCAHAIALFLLEWLVEAAGVWREPENLGRGWGSSVHRPLTFPW